MDERSATLKTPATLAGVEYQAEAVVKVTEKQYASLLRLGAIDTEVKPTGAVSAGATPAVAASAVVTAAAVKK